MFGKPEDVEGECNAHLYIGDDFGDGVATVRCPLPQDHDGQHQEKFYRGEDPVVITWMKDERYKDENGEVWDDGDDFDDDDLGVDSHKRYGKMPSEAARGKKN